MKKITLSFVAISLALGMTQVNAQDFEGANQVELSVSGVPGHTDFVVTGGSLYSNGPLVNMPGGGAGGNDLSLLESVTLGMNILGFGHALTSGYRVADDVTFDTDVELTSIELYAYQTGSTTTSTINHVNLRIWAGSISDVMGGSATLVWGDDLTNVMTSTEWAGIYRASESNTADASRPIMVQTIDLTLSLSAGTYVLDWQTGGTLASGPWAPPIAILGQTDTGNGIQFDGAMWAELVDTGTSGIEYFPQGLPFEIYGSEVIGISDNVFTGFNFYPNPSTDIINVTSKATINNLSVYNMLGQQLINVSVDGLNHQLNISDLSAGMYIMKAVVDGVEKSFNIVKK
ncbi:MAG TPA: T9SS type A sorting domain-containing protein [Flavobacteriaceae bacterium]|nr:T9SS type A sorting domain-containing protein [Flavobacteriaceae bacterium]